MHKQTFSTKKSNIVKGEGGGWVGHYSSRWVGAVSDSSETFE